MNLNDHRIKLSVKFGAFLGLAGSLVFWGFMWNMPPWYNLWEKMEASAVIGTVFWLIMLFFACYKIWLPPLLESLEEDEDD